MVAYLSRHRACIVCSSGKAGASAVLVWYRNVKLEVDCLVPRWADVTYQIEENPRVLLIVPAGRSGGLRWLEYRGMARPLVSPDWRRLLSAGTSYARPENRYLAIRVTPERLDLVDESRGWGARETLEV